MISDQHDAFRYFLDTCNLQNGLVADTTREGSPCSIAATGMALTCYPIGVERGWLSRADAIQRTLAALRFFGGSEQSTARDATGYKGFYYHFLYMKSGRRVWNCELSTIDTALLLAGVLCVAQYFDLDTPLERELRARAQELYLRTDWRWAQNLDHAASGYEAVSQGWRPESKFLRGRWQGYNEALILYALGLGSPTHPLSDASYPSWCSTYRWKKVYNFEYLYCGPLFTHQFSHCWIDFRGLQDDFMRGKGIDYFENSRRATLVHQEYSRRNPRGFAGYGEWSWGLTAGDGPGRATKEIDGHRVRFFGYQARGAPFGPDDGTLSPWAVFASLPFAPEIVLPTLERLVATDADLRGTYGFHGAFNPTYGGNNKSGWIAPEYFGINQGPIVMMIENYQSELIWRLMKNCPYIAAGLRRAGFSAANGTWKLGDLSTWERAENNLLSC